MVIDVVFGCILMVFLYVQADNAYSMFKWVGQFIHLEVLKKQTEWLINLPGAFRPNPNLSEFIVCAILDLIYLWNYISTAIMKI